MVSFCAVRLEIEENNPKLDIEFNCGRSLEDLFEDMELTNPVAAAAKASAAKDTDTKANRGKRAVNDIMVETITDFSTDDAVASSSKESSQEPRSSKESSPLYTHSR